MRQRHGKRPRAKLPPAPLAAAAPGGGRAGALSDQGAALGGMGRLEEALSCFESALRLQPDHVDALNNRGLLLGMMGRHAEALSSLEHAARFAPQRFDLLCNRGYSLNELGRHQEALELLQQAVTQDPRHFGAHNNHALALARLGRLEEAAQGFAAALSARPGDAGAQLNLALTLEKLRRDDEAMATFDRILAASPGQPDALNGRGCILLRQDRLQEALDCFDRVLARHPGNVLALGNRAVVLNRLFHPEEALACCDELAKLRQDDVGLLVNRAAALAQLARHDEALACVDRALELEPGHHVALVNRASNLFRLHRLDAAMQCLQQVLAAAPDDLEALNAHGAVLWGMDRAEEARAVFDRVLKAHPGHVNAINNLSLIDLAHGRLPEGFAGQELRWQTYPMSRGRFQTRAPQWDGKASLHGKSLLISHEQGFGDSLQFVRYALLAARSARKVMLAVPKGLADVLKTLPGEFDFITENQPVPPHDYHIPMMSLPLAFGTTLQTIPAQMVPYLAADPQRSAAWAQRLGPRRRPRIGITWAGRQYPPVNYPRDMALQLLRPLFDLDADFITLQKDVPAADRELLESLPQLQRHGEALDDFADTAALIDNVDLVLAVDTSVVHLAGAMGKPVWMMNRYGSCWRWLRNRDDSPWYPSLRQFRQPRLDDWPPVVAAVRGALQDYIRVWSAAPAAAPLATPAEAAPAVVVAAPVPPPPSSALRAELGRLMERGLAAAGREDYEEALGCFTEILTRQPGHFDALLNLGATLGSAGYDDEALTCFDQAVAQMPDHPGLLRNRGLMLGRLSRFEEALACFEHLLALQPDNLRALESRGIALANLERHDEALASYERALQLAPQDAALLRHRGFALASLHRFEEALLCFWRLLALRPDDAELHLNRGIALDKLGRRDEALACYERALELDPQQHEARCDRGLNRLARGDFGGFEDFESRWDAFLQNARPNSPAPQWNGESPHGKTILLHHEQGYGDTLQFVRYASAIVRAGGRVILLVPAPLAPLLRGLDCEVRIEIQAQGQDDEQALPPHDYHCPMMSLPRVFGTTVDSIPAPPSYLHADAARSAAWDARLGAHQRPRIGLAWAGRQYRPVNYSRDMPLEALVPLLSLPADFVSLQGEVPMADRALLDSLSTLARHGEALQHFADTAALIANLDLVITVDTAVAHLAGAMGKPVWILNRYAACWRWLGRREDTPWYPSARLFHQPSLRDWAGIAEQVQQALAAFLQGHDAAPAPAAAAVAPQATPPPAAKAAPESAAMLLQRGLALGSQHRDQEALACFERALAAQPDLLDAQFNRGLALDRLGRRDEALHSYEAVLQVRPSHAPASLNRSLILLGSGDYEEGFRQYEHRWLSDPLRHKPMPASSPRWWGEQPLAGKTILVLHEQGYGDTLQFARYLPLLARQAGRVVVGVPAGLQAVLRSLPAPLGFVVDGEPLPPHDYHIPMMSLPLAFGTTLDSIPAQIPYLSAEPARAAAWRARLGGAGRLRIGLVWAGRQYPPLNHARDMSLQLLRPLFELDAEFICLQQEIPAADRELQRQLPLACHGEALGDFADTAALIANLDLVITVDTAVAHLAGAMGKSVWLMNRYASCWRWLRQREDSPWYPGLRQFRQPALGDWPAVVRKLHAALLPLVERHEALA